MTNDDAKRILGLLEGYRPFIRYHTPSIYDPDDVFQEVCLAVLQKRINPTPHWMLRVAVNIAYTHCRREKLRRSQQLTPDMKSGDEASPFDTLQESETRDIVHRTVGLLNPKDRYVIERRFYSDESFEDMSHELGVAKETVRSRYKRAAKRLKTKPSLTAIA